MFKKKCRKCLGFRVQIAWTKEIGLTSNRPSPIIKRLSLRVCENPKEQAQAARAAPPSHTAMVTMATTANRKIETYEEFAKVHALLLAASGLPECLHQRLFEKLYGESFDGGKHFKIEPCEGGCQRRLVLTSASMEKNSDVFLVDHAWTFRLSDAFKQVFFLIFFFVFFLQFLALGFVLTLLVFCVAAA